MEAWGLSWQRNGRKRKAGQIPTRITRMKPGTEKTEKAASIRQRRGKRTRPAKVRTKGAKKRENRP